MKHISVRVALVSLAALLAGNLQAQETDNSDRYHPFLSDTFYASLGSFRPKKNVTLGLSDGSSISEEVDATDTETTASLSFRWRYTENWSLWAQYWSTDSSSEDVLENDAVWDDVTFRAGSSIEAGIDSSIFRLFFGRSFFRKPQSEWGVGAGLHLMELEAFISTDVATSPDIPDINGTRRKSMSGGVPLPNLGAWYMYSWSPKWVTTVRLDWLEVELGEYSGNLYNASAGVNYQVLEHVGIGLALNAFEFRAEVDRDGFNGEIRSRQWGPFLSLTANL